MAKIDRENMRRFYSVLYELGKEEKELDEVVQEKKDKFPPLLEHSPPWSHLYEMPYNHLLALFLITTGLSDAFVTASSNSPSMPELFDKFEELTSNIEDDTEHAEVTDIELSSILTMLMAIMGNVSCIRMYSTTLNGLIEKVREGNDEALFDAVLVDRVALSSPTIARRIQMAHMLGDESFFDSLSKAVKKTRPRRPLQVLDDTRYMIEALDEIHGLADIPHEDLFDFLANDLEVYHSADDKRDPAASLKQLVRRRKYSQ